MTSMVGHPMLRNYQVSVHWPAHPRRGRKVSRAWERFKLWRERMRQRTELARLDDRALHDIGRSEADAHHELAKWFWQE